MTNYCFTWISLNYFFLIKLFIFVLSCKKWCPKFLPFQNMWWLKWHCSDGNRAQWALLLMGILQEFYLLPYEHPQGTHVILWLLCTGTESFVGLSYLLGVKSFQTYWTDWPITLGAKGKLLSNLVCIQMLKICRSGLNV